LPHSSFLYPAATAAPRCRTKAKANGVLARIKNSMRAPDPSTRPSDPFSPFSPRESTLAAVHFSSVQSHCNPIFLCSFCLFKKNKSKRRTPVSRTRGTIDIVEAESSGEDPRATGWLVSNLPHPRVNKTKQHGSYWCTQNSSHILA